jgi:nucleoid DNA-binding protein
VKTLKQLKKSVSKRVGIDYPSVSKIISIFINEITTALKNDEDVQIYKLGKFNACSPVGNRILKGKQLTTRKKRRIKFDASTTIEK